MRKYIVIVLVLLGISCSNRNTEATADYETVLKSSEFNEDEFQGKEISLEQLTSQKLQDYFELVQLQKKHPQFKGEIEKQLKSFTKSGILGKDTTVGVDISNIKHIGEVVKVSDSVVKLKLIYDRVNNNTSSPDSIHAFITTKNVHLDDIQTVSNQIVFERID